MAGAGARVGRASESLCLLFLIPHGPGQALFPGNQLSQNLRPPYPFISCPTCQWLLPRALSPPHGGEAPAAGFLFPRDGRGCQRSPEPGPREGTQPGCSFRSTVLLSSPSSSSRPLLLLQHLSKVHASLKTWVHPTNVDPLTFGFHSWLCC